nr:MAG: hypothetical protein [Lokiarchaeota virus Skoll Meg22_1214]
MNELDHGVKSLLLRLVRKEVEYTPKEQILDILWFIEDLFLTSKKFIDPSCFKLYLTHFTPISLKQRDQITRIIKKLNQWMKKQDFHQIKKYLNDLILFIHYLLK